MLDTYTYRFMYLHKIETMTDTEQIEGVSPNVSRNVDFQTVAESRIKSR
jgi:hypothetical protein